MTGAALYTKSSNDGSVYLVCKIRNEFRKAELGVFYIKEQERNNLAITIFNDNNKMVRKVDNATNGRYVAVDAESCLCVLTGIMIQYFSSSLSQGVNALYLPIMSMKVDIARHILNDTKWTPLVKHIATDTVTLGTVSKDPDTGNRVALKFNKGKSKSGNKGVGSGIGVVTSFPLDVREGKAVKINPNVIDEQGIATGSFETPPVTAINNFEIEFIQLGDYQCGMIPMVGNQMNGICVSANSNNGVYYNKSIKLFSA
jgi:hypothetical protein